MKGLKNCMEIRAQGIGIDRLFNICAEKNIEFWSVFKPEETVLCMKIKNRDLETLRAGTKSFCEIKVVKKEGVMPFIRGLRKRWALFAGTLLFIGLVWIPTLFVWKIEVKGNEKVSSERIVRALEEIGFKTGSFIPAAEPPLLQSKLIYAIDELAWASVNIKGSCATVNVRERIQKPEIADENSPARIVAKKGGLITKIQVYEGKAVIKEKDTVEKGDELVSGNLESLSSGNRLVHAAADIYARTWYEISGQMPSECFKKIYTGREKTKYRLIIANKSINLYLNGGISFTDCDKIIMRKDMTLPGGAILPVSIVSEKYIEYEKAELQNSREYCTEILQDGLLKRLKAEIGDGRVMLAEFEEREEDGAFTLALTAECLEQIGKTEKIEESGDNSAYDREDD